MTQDELNKKIAGCFGGMDLIFMSHPLDEKRATALRNECDLEVSIIVDAARTYLISRSATQDKIDKEISKVRAFFSKRR